jgi:hypothetical protein
MFKGIWEKGLPVEGVLQLRVSRRGCDVPMEYTMEGLKFRDAEMNSG